MNRLQRFLIAATVAVWLATWVIAVYKAITTTSQTWQILSDLPFYAVLVGLFVWSVGMVAVWVWKGPRKRPSVPAADAERAWEGVRARAMAEGQSEIDARYAELQAAQEALDEVRRHVARFQSLGRRQ